MALDLEALAVDGTETVQYQQKAGEGAFLPAVAVPLALRRAVTKQGDLMRLPLNRQKAAWHLWASQLGGAVPKEGDRLTSQDGSAVWVVKEVDVMALATRYRCLCYRAN